MSQLDQSQTAEAEREQLLKKCHGLVDSIARHRYGVRLLRAARNGLQLYVKYKHPAN